MTLTLKTQLRTVTGKHVQTLRNQQQVPLVVYGRGKKARSLQADVKAFRSVLEKAGATSLVDVTIDGETPIKVLIHDVQNHPTTGAVIHADLLEIDMAKKITAEVPLVITGESAAVEMLEGSLLITQDTLEVECLPEDLPKELTLDISVLATFDDAITAGSIKLPDGVTLLTEADTDIALVQPPREEEAEETVSAEEAEKAVVEGMEAEAAAAQAESDEATDSKKE